MEHLSTDVEHHNNNNNDREKEKDRIDWRRSKVQELSSQVIAREKLHNYCRYQMVLLTKD
jgi:hypothetical protein